MGSRIVPVTKAYTYMDLSNLSSVSNVYAGGNQMNAISGASSYVSVNSIRHRPRSQPEAE